MFCRLPTAARTFPCVVKVLTLLGEGEALARQRAEVQREIAALERLRNCETVVTLYDTAWYPLREAEQAAGWTCCCGWNG